MAEIARTLSLERLPRIGLGTWALGSGNDWGETPETAAQQTLQTALEQGICLIDTAPIYGAGLAEERVGRAVKNCRQQVFLATKCGICLHGTRPDHDLRPATIRQECEDSLRRLQTDYIDLYQIHWPDPKVPLSEALGEMLRLQEQGKIRAIGVCNVSTSQLEQACQTAPIVSVQGPLSLLQPATAELAAFCQARGIAFWAYGVLGGGILSGKYKKVPNFRRCDARRYFYNYYFGDSFEQAQHMVYRVKEVAGRKHTTAGAVALAWTLAQPGVRGVWVGARRPEQVLENIHAAQLTLSGAEQEFLYGADS